MDTTRATLIQRVREADDRLAWEEFYELYSWLIYHYVRGQGLNDTDAHEIVGECMMILSCRMRDFEYDPDRCRFRSYLRNIVRKELAASLRKKRPRQAEGEAIAGLCSKEPHTEDRWDQQWEINHMLHCWRKFQQQLAPRHARAFKMYVIEELPVEDVARELNMTPGQVYQIKNRTTDKLRRAMIRLLGQEFLEERPGSGLTSLPEMPHQGSAD